MTINLKFIHETDSARLYERKDGEQIWIPESVVKSTLKHSAKEGEAPVHELEVEDWFAQQRGLE